MECPSQERPGGKVKGRGGPRGARGSWGRRQEPTGGCSSDPEEGVGQAHGGGFRTEEDRELTAKVTGSLRLLCGENPAREQGSGIQVRGVAPRWRCGPSSGIQDVL